MEIKRLDFLLGGPDQTVWYDLLPHSGTLAFQIGTEHSLSLAPKLVYEVASFFCSLCS